MDPLPTSNPIPRRPIRTVSTNQKKARPVPSGQQSERRKSHRSQVAKAIPKPIATNTSEPSKGATSWPEIIDHLEDGERPPVDERKLRLQRSLLRNHGHSLKVTAYQTLLRLQLAPLNPVLAMPPAPHFLLGTRWERIFETNLMLEWMSTRHGLPSIVWDVRSPPHTAFITAWPYYTGPHMTRRDQMKRLPVSASDLIMFYNQVITDPPCTVITLRVTKGWSIRLRSFDPVNTLCVRDVIEAVYIALHTSFDGGLVVARDPKDDKMKDRDVHQGRYDSLGGKYLWVGLRRDERERADETRVREVENGEVDGGTWWLLLRKP